MSKGSEPAYPVMLVKNGDGIRVPATHYYEDCGGLTKREAFAMAAMQGLIAQTPHAVSAAEIARQSVICAASLLAELAKEREDD
jgi:hypothetical protein